MIDHSVWKDQDLEVDLERGVSNKDQDFRNDCASSGRKPDNTLPEKVSVRFVDGSNKVENGFILSANSLNSNGVSSESLEVGAEKKLIGADNLESAEKRSPTEKRKKTSNKKPPRPPRPPRGPSIDAADQKMIREIAELAMLKKARIERMKNIKKMKTTKSSSCRGNILAMVFTVLFFLVIVFQGMPSKSLVPNFQGSPSPGGPSEGSLISVHYYPNPSASVFKELDPKSSELIEQVAGSGPIHELKSDVR